MGPFEADCLVSVVGFNAFIELVGYVSVGVAVLSCSVRVLTTRYWSLFSFNHFYFNDKLMLQKKLFIIKFLVLKEKLVVVALVLSIVFVLLQKLPTSVFVPTYARGSLDRSLLLKNCDL